MVLYVVGLGLGDEQDITLRGLNAVKKSKKVFLENYTSVLGIELSRLVRPYACLCLPRSVYAHTQDVQVSYRR